MRALWSWFPASWRRAVERQERWRARLKLAGISDLENLIINKPLLNSFSGPKDIETSVFVMVQAVLCGKFMRDDYRRLAECNHLLSAEMRNKVPFDRLMRDCLPADLVIALLRVGQQGNKEVSDDA